jgi:5'-nucleotidase
MKRRIFLKTTGLASMALGTNAYGIENILNSKLKKLVILHTNDWHSRIEPFPVDKSRNSNKGGAARRAGLINKIKKEESNILLLDAGDIFQGTPYFNYFGGELEFKLMSEMGYNAATMGNHDFDGGMDGFKKAQKYANFDFITTNYDFTNTILEGHTKKYKIINANGIKVGLFSANIELDGLVGAKLYKETKYLDPIEIGNDMANKLKNEHKCDYIICLSHLGYRYRGDKVSDITLASQSKDIDLIIGGHTHTFMKKPDEVLNKNGKKVIVTQAGWAGILLGRLDIYFDKKNKYLWTSGEYI